MSTPESEHDAVALGRRELLSAIAASGGVLATRLLLPAAWSTPLVIAHALPAHAQLSSSQTLGQPASNSTRVTPQPITARVSGDKVTLTVATPSSVMSDRTQFQVVEQLDDTKATPATKFIRVVGLMTPSADPQLSGSFQLELTRSPGDYDYQLRWDGHHTEWLRVKVGAP